MMSDAELTRDGINKRASFKEIFFDTAAIIGFIVDLITLLSWLPIRVGINGRLEINPPPATETLISVGSFHMAGETFTGYLLLIVIITGLFGIAFYERRTDGKHMEFLGRFYIGAVNLLIFLWFFIFTQNRNLSAFFLIAVGIFIPWLFLMSNHVPWSKSKYAIPFLTLPRVFFLVITLVFVSIIEVGYFDGSSFGGFFLSMIALVLGFILFLIELFILLVILYFLRELE
jgi:hypothetical protein